MQEPRITVSLYLRKELVDQLRAEADKIGRPIQAHIAIKLGEDPKHTARCRGGDKVRQFIAFVQDFLARAEKDPTLWTKGEPAELNMFRLYSTRLGNLKLYDPRAPKPWKLDGTKYADLQPADAPVPTPAQRKRAKLAPASP